MCFQISYLFAIAKVVLFSLPAKLFQTFFVFCPFFSQYLTFPPFSASIRCSEEAVWHIIVTPDEGSHIGVHGPVATA